jgi:hypothetical protein
MRKIVFLASAVALTAFPAIAMAQRGAESVAVPGRAIAVDKATVVLKPIKPIPARIAQQFTAINVSTSASLIPECEVVTIWDNIKKVFVTKQNGKVRFKMAGSAPGGAQIADAGGNWMVPFVANGVTPGIDVSGAVFLVADANWSAFSTPMSVNGQFYLFGGQPVVVFNWPTGLSLWKNYRWATNQCNNQPIAPLTASQSSAVLEDIKTLLP